MHAPKHVIQVEKAMQEGVGWGGLELQHRNRTSDSLQWRSLALRHGIQT